MVYAIISIGLLGFIVWSFYYISIQLVGKVMALLCRETVVINFTIGWDVMMLLTTFYSSNVNNYNQSAGNSSIVEYAYFCKKKGQFTIKRNGSSETIRESSFVKFRNSYEQFYSKSFYENDNWLFWLVGFIEGDGAILEHKGRCRLVITQKDPKVLIEIQNTLGFGKVKNFDKYSRFIVEDNNNCLLLYLILNGNLVLEHRINQLSKWYFSLNKAPKLKLESLGLNLIPFLIKKAVKPSLSNSWISGFTDAEGCFSIVVGKNRKNEDIVKARFILDQKNGENALNFIAELFSPITVSKRGYPVKLRKNSFSSPALRSCSLANQEGVHTAVFRLTISTSDIKNPNSMLIKTYFNKFNLKTSKEKSFLIWVNILELILGKQPLEKDQIASIKRLSSKMNKFVIENNPTGSARFS